MRTLTSTVGYNTYSSTRQGEIVRSLKNVIAIKKNTHTHTHQSQPACVHGEHGLLYYIVLYYIVLYLLTEG